MMYDERFFEQRLSRKGTHAVKWDGVPASLLPMWVADMDFPSPPAVTEALCQRAAHPVYGYTGYPNREHVEAMRAWWLRRHGLTMETGTVLDVPGVVTGLRLALRSLTKPQDAVLIQTPVYGPFYHVVEENHRQLVSCPLCLTQQGWRMDFAEMDRLMALHQVKAMILCNPHNPVGRVWTRQELAALLDLCAKHHVILLCDEIHADFVYPGHRHVPILALKGAQDCALAFLAPSKTFNIAGIPMSSLVVPNPQLRGIIDKERLASGVEASNLFAYLAMQTAYEQGEAWLEGLLRYLDGNRRMLAAYMAEHLPMIGFTQVEGTYLTLLDMRAVSPEEAALCRRLEADGGVALSHGSFFGAHGWMRLNFGCPRPQLAEALDRMKRLLL